MGLDTIIEKLEALAVYDSVSSRHQEEALEKEGQLKGFLINTLRDQWVGTSYKHVASKASREECKNTKE